MIENPERLKHLLMKGIDPETERSHPRYLTHEVPANLYRGYLETHRRADSLKDSQQTAQTFAGTLGLEIVDIIKADGKEPTGELINEVAQIVFDEVDAEYNEKYPDFNLPPHPAFQAPDEHKAA